MELGVDIGDLNTLLLYGTPPNANSYLQRIGRAGRSSGNSLIHSVSQRNPIDYYYHEHPEELIAADPQQVPLNEVNREVLHQSLSWAVLDWATTTRWVPWRREQSGFEDLVVCKDEPTFRTDPRPNDIMTFTGVLASTNFKSRVRARSRRSKHFGHSSKRTGPKSRSGWRIFCPSASAQPAGENMPQATAEVPARGL